MYSPLVSTSTTHRVRLLHGPFERFVLNLSGLSPVILDIGHDVSKCEALLVDFIWSSQTSTEV